MANMGTRRSNRIPLSLPIEISGVDKSGEQFYQRAITTSINRHGCSISIDGTLLADQEVALRKKGAAGVAIGRVECHIGTESNLHSYGIEIKNATETLWGVKFSSSFHEQLLDALSKCRNV